MTEIIVHFLAYLAIFFLYIIEAVGIIGGLFFAIFWLCRPRPADDQSEPVEIRCCSCAERSICPAADTGVCYPCPWYVEKK